MIALFGSIKDRVPAVERINLADNAVTDFGMPSVKNVVANCKGEDGKPNLKSLNLASNMISGEGMELFLDDLIANTTLEVLDLGVLESSMRKNSLGIQGAVCLSALLIRNKTLQQLIVNDNDFGSDGGECIGVALQ